MSHLSTAGPGIRGIQRTMEQKDERIEYLESRLAERDARIHFMVESLKLWHDSLGYECSAASEGLHCCVDTLIDILEPPIDPNLKKCIECGTEWTAPVDECPSPWLHPGPGSAELVVPREKYPDLYDAIEQAYAESDFTKPEFRLPKAGFDVVGTEGSRVPDYNPYKTRLVGVFWSTGFCSNCQKTRFNVDNDHGLCGHCAEELYPQVYVAGTE